MTKQINVRISKNEAELQEWANKQHSISGSIKLLIRQAVARYGTNIDVQEAMIKENIRYTDAKKVNKNNKGVI